MTFMKFFGYKKRTNFLTGISIAQISELSLILVFLGFTAGAITQRIMSLTVLIALITITLSSYGIYYSRHLYRALHWSLGIFDGKGKEPGIGKKREKRDIILFGYNRIGFNLLKAFNKKKKKYLIVDYNPKTISELSDRGISCVYGDANDIELLHSLNMNNTKIVISTVPELETNLAILRSIHNKRTVFIPTSHSIGDTQKLYEEGADYVIMPHFLGGNFIAHMLLKDDFNKKLIDKEGVKQIRELEERMFEGHEHPSKDNHGT